MKILKQLTLCASVCMASFNYAQTSSNWLWAKGSQNSSGIFGETIVANPANETYVGGNFSSSTLVLGTATLTNAGGVDFFIAKYDANGNLLWASRYGGTGDDYIRSMAINANGVAITGNFNSSSLTLGTTVLSVSNGPLFAGRFNLVNGVFAWAVNAGSTGSIANDVKLNSSTEVFITGKVEGTSSKFGSTTFSHQQGSIFLARYNSSGVFQNVNFSTGGNSTLFSENYGKSLAIDASGNIYVLGYYEIPVTFGTTAVLNPGLLGNYSPNICLVKYNSTGTSVTWSRRITSNDDFQMLPNAVITSTIGDVFLSAQTANLNGAPCRTVNFNVVPAKTIVFCSTYATFVAKYNSSGTFLDARWANKTISNDPSISVGIVDVGNRSMAIDITGNNLYLSGTSGSGVSTVVRYDATVLGLTPNPNFFPSLAEFTSTGTGTSVARALFVNLAGNSIHVTGKHISGAVNFSTNNLPNTNAFFVSRIGTCTLPSVPTLGSPSILEICPNTSATITANGSGPIRYFTASSGGTLLGLGTPNTFITAPIAVATSTIFAEASNNCGVSTSRFPFVIKLAICGREDEGGRFMNTSEANVSATNWLDFKTTPNPNNGQFMIELINTSAANVTIFDYAGKVVYNTTLTNTKTEFDLSTYAKGLYVVSIQANGKTLTKKLMLN